ncbi:MAG TPA: transcription-repair coupling factor [Candidatus Acidoferrales bacterium]|nr:transcription-repair coupling factor [Candidatus Acidoferrales bacterium]
MIILPYVDELLSRVARLEAVDAALTNLRRGARESRITGLTPEAKIVIAAKLGAELRRPAVLVVGSDSRADEAIEAVRYLLRASGGPNFEASRLPALETAIDSELPPHPKLLEERALALWHFVRGESNLLVTTAAASLWRYESGQRYRELGRELRVDLDIAPEDFLQFLETAGYARGEMVEAAGQYARRGGIIDVFPAEAKRPVRVELLGDSVASLREFDAATQRSIGPVGHVLVPSLIETASNGKSNDGHATARETASLFDLVERPLVIFDEPASIEESMAKFRERIGDADVAGDGDAASGAGALETFLSPAEWADAAQRHQVLVLEELAFTTDGAALSHAVRSRPTQKYHGNIEEFFRNARTQLSAGEQIVLSASSLGEVERFADLCHEYELPYRLAEVEETASSSRLADESSAGSVPAIVLSRLAFENGVAFPDSRLTLFGISDVFDHRAAPPARSRAKSAAFISDFSDLKPGDFVVHVDHGIGQFDGLRQLEADGAHGEFMLLKYADDARLYVPLSRMDLVQSYRAVEGAEPQLDKLGGTSWTTRKARVRKALAEMAEQLLKLYAQRRVAAAHAFPADTPWQKEFEDAFEFDETRDQETAIADIKRDMERAIPMDRLLCGDVGYGKTEVAMRAAFKAVCDGRQVAILAPTTVLVFQHYETFRNRFAAFPIKIEMLSRFRSGAQQKQTLKALAAGELDVVIGTHRLLSKDVRFKELGLLVVDEEQRFGVAHKERIKEIRQDVHVLTMSATPIPRTLHMAMAGVRDLSVIETPPKDRLAIQTVVAPFGEGLIRRAIQDEIDRQGQVFVIHNRVESIHSIAHLIQKLVPRARVVVGHGQMTEKALESVMLRFMHDEADVLISTTIVENGLDIPRANTIIINRADRFGLSELYQLRGRVGRANQRAYAYMLVAPGATLTPIARRRLAALKEFSDLGAGFRIAALDLELRGAGNLLGRQQHGHIDAVGFDLYTKMLEQAVAALKGESVATDSRATINIGVDLRIPADYIPSENLRLRTYKKISEISDESQREEVRNEIADRFGNPPTSIDNLLDYALLKSQAEKLRVAAIDRKGPEVGIRFHADTTVKPENLVTLLRSRRGLRLDPSGTLFATIRRGNEPLSRELRGILLQLQV